MKTLLIKTKQQSQIVKSLNIAMYVMTDLTKNFVKFFDREQRLRKHVLK